MIAQIFSATEPRVYLLGNPLVWWTNLTILLICPIVFFLQVYSKIRSFDADLQSNHSKHFWAAATLFSIWALHYFPFFFMYRTLYVHHYYPALYFSCLLTGVTIDWGCRYLVGNLPNKINNMLYISFLV